MFRCYASFGVLCSTSLSEWVGSLGPAPFLFAREEMVVGFKHLVPCQFLRCPLLNTGVVIFHILIDDR